jgi:hypothetical protein
LSRAVPSPRKDVSSSCSLYAPSEGIADIFDAPGSASSLITSKVFLQETSDTVPFEAGPQGRARNDQRHI